MNIILLNGFSCCGKDYIGNIICNKYNYKRYAAADSLKRFVADKYNIDLSILHSQEGKAQICDNDTFLHEKKRSHRQILIDEALEQRNINNDIFISLCCNEIVKNNDSNVIITDWRYENEYKYIRTRFLNAHIVKVHIKRYDQYKSPINDISEYELINKNINFDYEIVNNMDDSVYKEIDKLIKII